MSKWREERDDSLDDRVDRFPVIRCVYLHEEQLGMFIGVVFEPLFLLTIYFSFHQNNPIFAALVALPKSVHQDAVCETSLGDMARHRDIKIAIEERESDGKSAETSIFGINARCVY
jgi:hypothetical protein